MHPLEDDDIPAELHGILREARTMQITRMNQAFQNGWRIPQEIWDHYYQWYASYRGTDPEGEVYNRTFEEFRDRVQNAAGFPPEWTSLDPMTLFAEICAGERMADGTLAQRASVAVQ